MTVEGTVAVDEEAPTSDRATDGQTSPIAMYVWRAAFARSGRTVVDFENRETRQARATFASGVEFGSFAVATGSGDVRSIRVDSATHTTPRDYGAYGRWAFARVERGASTSGTRRTST